MQDNMKEESRIKDLETIREVFEKYKVPFFVVYGVALGFHRDGSFLPGDDDIDLAVIEPIDLKTRKAIGWDLWYLGFQPQQITFNVPNASSQGFQMEPSEIGYNGDHETGIIVCERNFKFTIFFFKEEQCDMHGEEYVCTPKLGAMKLISTPTRFYKKSETIKINKKKYQVPSPIEEYLDFTYFNNWKDKTDRRHGETYLEMHEKGASLDLEGKNQVTTYENVHE